MPAGWISAAVGVIGAISASSAADTQAQAAGNAQQISQQQYQDTVNRNAPFTQAGYGALSALDWGMGIGPQTSGGQPTGGMGPGTSQPNGYDPSSGYRLGPGGSVSQGISNPGGMSSIFPGIGSGPGVNQGSGMPAPQGAQSPQGGQTGGQTGGLGYGSLTKAFDTSDWQKLSPAYNFQLRQGQQGVMNADAAGAGALSGSAQKDLIDYNQGAANQSFNSAFNQYQTQQGNIFSRLSGIAGLGQNSANNTGQQGTTLAGQAGQAAVAAGSYNAAGTVGAANAIGGGLSGAAPWLASGWANRNSNPSNWDTENPNNFQDFQSSDRRLKTDIQRLGTLDSGIPIYRFRYRDSGKVHIGVMADELERVYPEAVATDPNGYLMVDYGRVR